MEQGLKDEPTTTVEPVVPNFEGLPPTQIFKKSLELEDKAFEREVIKAHWHLLESCISKPRPENGALNIDPIEEVYYNFGAWCGEQLKDDPEVMAAKAESLDISGSKFYHNVFETLVEEVLDYKPSSHFLTLTEWLKCRDKTYQLMAEVERFKIPNEVLRQLPENARGYLKARDTRQEKLDSLSPKIKIVPGLHAKLQNLIISGSLHERIDALKLQSFMTGDDKENLQKLISIWSSVEKQLATIFKDPETLDTVADIHKLSDSIITIANEEKIDFNEVFKAARELYLDEGNSFRRLTRDVQMIKNNLNISSIKSKFGSHNPLLKRWPEPIKFKELDNYRERTLKLDKSFNSENEILLAPGKFNGFYEFDRGTLIFPICSSDAKFQWTTALVQYRFTIETLKSNSTFLSDLKQLKPGEKLQETFFNIYASWLENGDNEKFFDLPKIEQTFLLKHVAPSLQTLFLRDEDFFIDAYKKEKMILNWKSGKLNTNNLNIIAGVFFSEKKLKESALLLKKLASLETNKPEIELPLVKVLLELNQKEEALSFLKKYITAKNLGYYQVYAKNILAKLNAN